MREIKFRAWDKTFNLMHKPRTLKAINKLNRQANWFEEKVVWLEYTGLKDKNGKEIYEGNIVKVTCVGSYGKEEWTHQVKYNKELACFSPFSYYHSQKLIGETEKEKFEVIGNIYQNPELLKEGK